MSRYALANADAAAHRRLSTLERVFDPGTVRVLANAGVGPGDRCLEVGAGLGSVAGWLAERVGPSGSVLATDIDPRFLGPLADSHPNLAVARHDVAVDPLPAGHYDLVHARLVLEHLPAREAALAAMVGALVPGGVLVVESVDFSSEGVDPATTPATATTFAKLHEARTRLLADAGFDLAYARGLARRLRAAGLVDVSAEGRCATWWGGPEGDRLWRLDVDQLRPRLLAGGYLTEADVAEILAMLDDPAFAATSPTIVAGVGRRPGRPD